MSARPVLGVDPGNEAGAVVLLDPDGRTVRAAWTWRRLKRRLGDVWRLDDHLGGTLTCHDLVEAAETIRRDLALVLAELGAKQVDLVVEGLFVAQGGKLNVQSVLPLAESAGILLGCLAGLAAGAALRPRASEWRPVVLGLGTNTPAAQAEAVAVRMGLAAFDGLGELAQVGHVAEAAWMARWGWVQARPHRGDRLSGQGGRK
jgi:hypothetical protein